MFQMIRRRMLMGFATNAIPARGRLRNQNSGKIVLLMGRKRVDLRVKNGNHNDRDLNQTT